jgi:hypothetical protein
MASEKQTLKLPLIFQEQFLGEYSDEETSHLVFPQQGVNLQPPVTQTPLHTDADMY